VATPSKFHNWYLKNVRADEKVAEWTALFTPIYVNNGIIMQKYILLTYNYNYNYTILIMHIALKALITQCVG